MATVNIGLVGIGNCAASLVQGLQYYSRSSITRGLAHPVCAGYSIADLRFTSAFDVHAGKIDRDLSEAIWLAPNNALKFADVPHLNVRVRAGVVGDGVGSSCAPYIPVKDEGRTDAIASHLLETDTHVVVNFLPTGSQHAAEIYAEAALQAGCAFINCMPAVIARSEPWALKFEAAGVPLLGDDLKSQFGATLIHHALIDTLVRNGVVLRHTSQVVSGGNMDFLNLQDPNRIQSKRATKTQGLGGGDVSSEAVHFAAEYVPALEDRKTAVIRIDGEAFGGTSIEMEVKMTLEDSPSAAGNVLDAVRYMKLARDRRQGGVLSPAAAVLMKAPPTPMADADARATLRAWVDEDSAAGLPLTLPAG